MVVVFLSWLTVLYSFFFGVTEKKTKFLIKIVVESFILCSSSHWTRENDKTLMTLKLKLSLTFDTFHFRFCFSPALHSFTSFSVRFCEKWIATSILISSTNKKKKKIHMRIMMRLMGAQKSKRFTYARLDTNYIFRYLTQMILPLHDFYYGFKFDSSIN